MLLVLNPKTKNRISFVSHETLLKSVIARALTDFVSLLISLSLPFAQTIFGTNREKVLNLRAFFIPRKPLILLGFRAYPLKFGLKRAFRFLL